MLRPVDLGEPIAYLALEDGVPVYSSDGERIGTVEHVLAVPEEDIFDGIVIDTRLGPGGHRFADAPQVAEIHENGVLLSLGSEAAARLPEPSENPAVLDAGPDETVPDDLGDKLRRAWQRISGDY
jgi:PRC-barrel domain